MNGTWKVTGTAGGGAALAVAAAVAALEGVAWVLANLLWILGTGAACAVLAGVAVARLMRWSDDRAARVWAQRPARLRAEPVPEVPRAEPAAIEGGTHVHLHYHAAPGAEVTTSSPWPTGDGRPASH